MTVTEFIYSVLLRPPPLRALANFCLRCMIPSKIHAGGATIVLNPKDPVISGALTLNVYEKTEARFFQSILKPGMTVLDIGASIGVYTALALPHVGPSGRIVALEPDCENFDYLRRTVAANNATNVTCIPKAAADQSGRMKLYVSWDNRGDNRLYDNELCDDSYEVELITLDALLGELGIAAVDVVKMDVQGYECRVLQGMRRTLEGSPNLTIMMEFWPHALRCAGTPPEEFLPALEKMGFAISELKPGGALTPIRDHTALIRRYPGRQYATIVACRAGWKPAADC